MIQCPLYSRVGQGNFTPNFSHLPAGLPAARRAGRELYVNLSIIPFGREIAPLSSYGSYYAVNFH